MFVPKLERFLGIEVYAIDSFGVGGVVRQRIEDFIVEEVLVDGSKAAIFQVGGQVRRSALGSSTVRNRYLLCVLIKRNWDTFMALKAVAKQFGIGIEQIQIAGIKDAKAVTAQHITIEGVSPEEIQRVQVKDIDVYPIGYFRSELSSYYLLGNRFHITIRAISLTRSKIKERIMRTTEGLKAKGGLPNFFGHQRFGTTRPITHLVGKAIVQGNFKKAAMLFLAKSSPHEHPESREARERLQRTQDFEQALKGFPKQLRYERLMLMHLAGKPDDFIGAFRRLPRRLRRLFPQAYQSYLFNRFLSRRIRKGLLLNGAEVGDYVVNLERSGLPMPRMRRTVSKGTSAEINKAVRVGKMRLAVPLVGFKQHLSKGVQGEIESQILKEENIVAENFRIEAVPEMSLRGWLRTALVPLNDFFLNKVSKDSTNPLKLKAEVSFALYRGSYATIVLRELLKPRNIIKAGF